MKHYITIIFTLIGVTLSAQNHWNNVGLFDGKSYLSTYSSKLNANHQSFSFEAWVKPDRDTATCSIMGKGQYTVALAGGRVFCVTNSLGQIRSKKQVQANEWVHFVITYQGGTGGAAKIYINGKIDTGISFTGTMFPTNDSFFIGRAPYAPKFSGEIDEVRVWAGARTAAEIDESYRLHLSQKGSSTLYPFLLYVQTFEDDLEMTGFVTNNANKVGNLTYRPVGTEPSTRVRHNDCIYFPGNSWLESSVANDSFLSFNGPISIELWVHPTAFDTRMQLIDMSGGGNGGGYQLALVQTARVNFYTVGGTNSSQSINLNTWYHIAIVGDKPSAGNQNFKMYVNGKLDLSFTLPLYNVNTFKLRIGASFSNSDYFKGYMDEIRIYNHERTYEEILRDMHRPLLLNNQTAYPKHAVAYNFDGHLFSGTGKGPELTSQNTRFAKTTELASPLFSTGITHDLTMSTYSVKHPWAAIPSSNTYGVISDTLNITKGKKIDANKFRVFLSMYHYNTADVRIVLISPTNDSVLLVNQHNLSGKQMTCIMDPTSGNRLYNNNLVEYGPAIGFDGNYINFNNKNSKGTWTLKVYDKNFGFTGILFSWGIHIEGEDITNLNSNVIDQNIEVYPNPVQRGHTVQLSIQNFNNGSMNVQIFDMQGRLMHSDYTWSNGKTMEVQLPDQLSSGQYLIRVSGTEQTVSALLMVE